MNPLLPLFDRAECLAALRALELPLRGGELEAPVREAARAAAGRHVDQCPDCRQTIQSRRERDDAIGQALRDVPVAADLQSRLLAALNLPADLTEAAEPAKARPLSFPAAPVPSRRVGRVRRWARSLVLVAGCLCAVTATWFAVRATRPVHHLDQLTAQVIEAEGPESLAEFENVALPPLPQTMNTRYLRDAPRRLRADSAAVYFFRFKTQRTRREITGRLLVIPVSSLKSVPEASSFLARPAVYVAGNFCASQWVEGAYAYVCLIKGGESDLDRLRPASAVAI